MELLWRGVEAVVCPQCHTHSGKKHSSGLNAVLVQARTLGVASVPVSCLVHTPASISLAIVVSPPRAALRRFLHLALAHLFLVIVRSCHHRQVSMDRRCQQAEKLAATWHAGRVGWAWCSLVAPTECGKTRRSLWFFVLLQSVRVSPWIVYESTRPWRAVFVLLVILLIEVILVVVFL